MTHDLVPGFLKAATRLRRRMAGHRGEDRSAAAGLAGARVVTTTAIAERKHLARARGGGAAGSLAGERGRGTLGERLGPSPGTELIVLRKSDFLRHFRRIALGMTWQSYW